MNAMRGPEKMVLFFECTLESGWFEGSPVYANV